MANIAKKKSAIIETYRCAKCGEDFERKDFYKANGGIYAEEGYLPVCKDCFKRIYMEFLAIYLDEEKAAKRICMTFDLYYSRAIFDTCDAYGQEAVIGNYIKRLNMNNNKGKSMKDSLEEGFTFLSNAELIRMVREDESEEVPNVSKRSVDQWGPGLDPQDYKMLDDHNKMLRDSNPNMDSNQEIFISDLCYTKMLQMKAMREGRIDDYNKLTESYRKSFTQAGLKTVRESTANNDVLLGVTAEMIEKYTPAEYYKDKKMFVDADGLMDYFERFVLRPIRNLQFGTKDRDKEFFVSEDGDENEYIDEEE